LYLVALLCVLFGFIAGGVVAWVSGGRRRRKARALADRNALLQRQLEELRRELAAASSRQAEPPRPRLTSATRGRRPGRSAAIASEAREAHARARRRRRDRRAVHRLGVGGGEPPGRAVRAGDAAQPARRLARPAPADPLFLS